MTDPAVLSWGIATVLVTAIAVLLNPWVGVGLLVLSGLIWIAVFL
jgi:hypothetical protein